MSRTAHTFVDDADVSRIAKRLESFAGTMERRDDGAYCSVGGDVIVCRNRALGEEFERFATVVHVDRGESESERRENGMRVFDALKSFDDAALLANFDFEETLATFAPKHSAA